MASSKLQRLTGKTLRKHFGIFRIWENHRPDWMETDNGGRLELDFYLEELKLGIEIQGEQHYRFIPHFHVTYERFEEQQERDRQKKEWCQAAGIRLIELSTENDLPGLVDAIRMLIEREQAKARGWWKRQNNMKCKVGKERGKVRKQDQNLAYLRKRETETLSQLAIETDSLARAALEKRLGNLRANIAGTVKAVECTEQKIVKKLSKGRR